MGYYTRYHLEIQDVDGTPAKKADLKNFLNTINSSGEELVELKDVFDFELFEAHSSSILEPYDTCRWYNHDSTMITLSSKLPYLVFRLSGEGEESGDLWRKYYHDGKCQYCPAKIEYDDFKIDYFYQKE